MAVNMRGAERIQRMEAGLVGLSYSGKTTLFTALTGLAIDPAASVLKPNLGIAKIPDPALGTLSKHIETRKIVPATMQIVDIPGLVKGSSEGKGLGNAFLNHLRQVDALVQVVRCFEDEGVPHIEGSVNPARDIDTVETELILADLQTLESALPKAEKSARKKDPEALARLEVLKAVAPILEDGQPARSLSFDSPELAKAWRGMGMLSAKRTLLVANVDEDDPEGQSDAAQAVAEAAKRIDAQSVSVCAKIESELAELEEDERLEMLEGLGIAEPALNRLARAMYKLLGLQSFYTAGIKETRAWTIHTGETAPEAAGEIHSDIQRGFIRAEIFSVADLDELGSEKAIKDAGRMRVEGKDYVMQPSDVVNFRFNV